MSGGILRSLKFKDVRIDIRGIYRIPRILIRWELETTSQNLKNLVFVVERGESITDLKPVSDWIPATSRREFMDCTPLLKDITKVYYYRIKAHELIRNQIVQTFESEIYELEDRPDLVATYVIEEHLFAHRYVYGAPTLIYTKRGEGARCDCWDPVMKRVTTSNCTNCKGVGFTQGYYDPIPAWMDFSPSPEAVQIADFGERQNQQTDIQFTDYPNIQIGDLILQLKPFSYWRVESVHSTMKNQVVILQMIRVMAVNKSDIEYSLSVPEDIVDKMIGEMKERLHEKEF